MNCDEARSKLFEFIEDGDGVAGRLTPAERRALEEHVADCESCTEDLQAVQTWRMNAQVWHDVPVPPWQPPRIARPPMLGWLAWFPIAASAAALVLVAVMLVGNFTAPAIDSGDLTARVNRIEESQRQMLNTRLDQWSREFENRRDVDQTLMLQTMLEATQSQRQQELEALVKLLKAEMDRQALQTEESLRYLVTHQIDDQERLDQLAARVQAISYQPEAAQ